ncbi:MAG: Ldh family oxidoreductase [Candidatus Bathyarchaeia archaeon]
MRVVSADELRAVVVEILVAAGVSPNGSRVIADHLVEANLRGKDSHGVFRLPMIVRGILKGSIKPGAEVKVVREEPATALLDGGQGIGQITSMEAMEMAVEKACKLGIGVVSVRRSSHIGFLGYYTEHAARSGMIGLAFTNTERAMAPFGGAEPIFGTNPISVAFPSEGGPILVDMATSVVARGKILEARRKGQKIPMGWAIDGKGVETEDPAEALKGTLLPIGGVKGYCLALAIDLLTGALSGASVGRNVRGTLHTEEVCTKGDLFIAINPEVFCGSEAFGERVEELRTQIKACKRAEGVAEVYLPGERSRSTRMARMRDGIPLDERLWDELVSLRASLQAH